MNLSFSSAPGHEISAAISAFSYRDVINADLPLAEAQPAIAVETDVHIESQVNLLPHELEQLLTVAKLEATAEAERRFRAELESKLAEESVRILQSLDEFTAHKKQYFGRVEGEVIRLALAIAAKILHREARADPMLIAAIVRIALDKLQESSSVSIRVPVSDVERWEGYMAPPPHGVIVTVVGDPEIGAGHCVLQAELGTVDFSIDAQLKEIEQGFFDLLALRPLLR